MNVRGDNIILMIVEMLGLAMTQRLLAGNGPDHAFRSFNQRLSSGSLGHFAAAKARRLRCSDALREAL